MKKNDHLYAVIMAGGSGERFWPVSRTAKPKQLLPIVGKKTMIQETVGRIAPLVPRGRIYVVTNREQAAEVRRQLPGVPQGNIVAEPMGRDTAPCIALAAALIRRRDPDGVMIVMPADHVIRDLSVFRATLADAARLCVRDDRLVTIGIRPSTPHTGYGYIKFGGKISSGTKTVFSTVERFEEKPDRQRAEQFLSAGNYYWNSGMFVWRAATILEEMKKYMPRLYDAAREMSAAAGKKDFARRIERIYRGLERRSIDYGVMEKSDRVVAAESNFYWDDVGSWASFRKYRREDAFRNVAEGDVVTFDTQDSVLIAKEGTVAVLGMKGVTVVKTADAVVVCPSSRLEEIKHLVKAMKENKKLRRYTE
ncbi:MAG TPA: mannose-1-phosphate guanylyltransferase [bacterium]|nr:mannose-1-phosphate guanylyltransferase [bacterium]